MNHNYSSQFELELQEEYIKIDKNRLHNLVTFQSDKYVEKYLFF